MCSRIAPSPNSRQILGSVPTVCSLIPLRQLRVLVFWYRIRKMCPSHVCGLVRFCKWWCNLQLSLLQTCEWLPSSLHLWWEILFCFRGDGIRQVLLWEAEHRGDGEGELWKRQRHLDTVQQTVNADAHPDFSLHSVYKHKFQVGPSCFGCLIKCTILSVFLIFCQNPSITDDPDSWNIPGPPFQGLGYSCSCYTFSHRQDLPAS